MRRLAARPSGVSLLATGSVSPSAPGDQPADRAAGYRVGGAIRVGRAAGLLQHPGQGPALLHEGDAVALVRVEAVPGRPARQGGVHLIEAGQVARRDVEALQGVGQPLAGQIVDQPVKIGWHLGTLFIEIHPALEEKQEPPAKMVESVMELLHTVWEQQPLVLDSAALKAALEKRNGIPVAIGRSKSD